MNINKIIDYINNEAVRYTNRNINRKLIINSLFFVVSSIIGLKRIKIEDQYINYLGISFAQSGMGKNLSVDIVEKLFNNIIEKYNSILAHNEPMYLEFQENFIKPNEYKIPLLGTIEGVMRVGNYINELTKGSINIYEDEFGSIMDRKILTFIIKMWQSASSAGSVNVNEAYTPIKNVPINGLFFGTISPFERNITKYEQLVETLETGFARRAFFVNIEKENIYYIEPKEMENIDWLIEDIMKFIKKNDGIIKLSKEAKEKIIALRKKLSEKYNKEQTEWNAINLTSIDKVVRASAIVAFINMHDEVMLEDVNFIIDFLNQSNKDILDIIKPKQAYIKMFEILKIKKSLFQTELIEELHIKMTKTEAKEQIEMLKEYAYRQNLELHTEGKMIHLLPRKETSLNEIIVSINKEGKKEKGIESNNYFIKFFGDGRSIETLCKNDSIDWFSFIHYNGTRKQANTIPEFNCIAFDIDELLPLDNAIDLLKQYTNIIYTTRNHDRMKNDIIADRYRIVLPLQKTINLEPSKYKQFLLNISKVIGIKNFIDTSTLEIARLWFPSPSGSVYKNENNILNPECCIPNTETQQKLNKSLSQLDNTNIDKRIEGAIRWCLSEAVVGSRNNTLFKFAMLVKDIGGIEEARRLTDYVNNMLNEPLSQKELVSTIFKRLK